MNSSLKLVVNNPHNQIEERQFFEKNELKTILDLYAKMVSAGSWKDYGLNISSRQVSFRFLLLGLKFLQILYKAFSAAFLKTLN